PPPGSKFSDIRLGTPPGSDGLIDATSKVSASGFDCARLLGACRTPMRMGPATAVIAVATSRSLLGTVTLCGMRTVIIASIRFLRSDPVTPDAQGNGDSR